MNTNKPKELSANSHSSRSSNNPKSSTVNNVQSSSSLLEKGTHEFLVTFSDIDPKNLFSRKLEILRDETLLVLAKDNTDNTEDNSLPVSSPLGLFKDTTELHNFKQNLLCPKQNASLKTNIPCFEFSKPVPLPDPLSPNTQKQEVAEDTNPSHSKVPTKKTKKRKKKKANNPQQSITKVGKELTELQTKQATIQFLKDKFAVVPKKIDRYTFELLSFRFLSESCALIDKKEYDDVITENVQELNANIQECNALLEKIQKLSPSQIFQLTEKGSRIESLFDNDEYSLPSLYGLKHYHDFEEDYCINNGSTALAKERLRQLKLIHAEKGHIPQFKAAQPYFKEVASAIRSSIKSRLCLDRETPILFELFGLPADFDLLNDKPTDDQLNGALRLIRLDEALMTKEEKMKLASFPDKELVKIGLNDYVYEQIERYQERAEIISDYEVMYTSHMQQMKQKEASTLVAFSLKYDHELKADSKLSIAIPKEFTLASLNPSKKGQTAYALQGKKYEDSSSTIIVYNESNPSMSAFEKHDSEINALNDLGSAVNLELNNVIHRTVTEDLQTIKSSYKLTLGSNLFLVGHFFVSTKNDLAGYQYMIKLDLRDLYSVYDADETLEDFHKNSVSLSK